MRHLPWVLTPFLRAGKVAISERDRLDLLDHHKAAWSLAVTVLTPEIGRVTLTWEVAWEAHPHGSLF